MWLVMKLVAMSRHLVHSMIYCEAVLDPDIYY
jgi:hypothetical protein